MEQEKIQFRFIKTGIVYMPQFKQPEFGDEWEYFTKDTFHEKSILGKLARAIASINNEPSWGSPIYHFDEDANYRVYFKQEFQVMAFLGGAKSYYSEQAVDFKI